MSNGSTVLDSRQKSLVIGAAVLALLLGLFAFFWIGFEEGLIAFVIVSVLPALLASLTGVRVGRRYLNRRSAGARDGLLFIFGLIAALILLYLIMQVRTPTSLHIVVNTEAISAKERAIKDRGGSAPFAWPDELVVKVGGSVVWHIQGDANHHVVIEFLDNESPFRKPDASPRLLFPATGRAPTGSLVIGAPVETAGKGKYKVHVYDGPTGGPVTTLDPPWRIPNPKAVSLPDG